MIGTTRLSSAHARTTAKKPSASDRTVDMFSRLSKEQEDLSRAAEKESLERALAEQEDAVEGPKVAEPIEVSAERWRSNALTMQEFVSKSFGKGDSEKGVFRLTKQKEWLFLEQFRLGVDGKAFHWAGLMFLESDLYELTSVFVRASKELKEKV